LTQNERVGISVFFNMSDPSAPQPGLITIGYEGRTLADYLAQLRGAGVTLLCDVRRNPISRKKGFSRRALALACADLGIGYTHLPELGIASNERKEVRTPADREALFERYERETLAKETGTLNRIEKWIQDDLQCVALTCFERNPCECHRRCVAKALGRTGIPSLQARDL
jgi:uncharacterized protein (DUF488 family)